MTLRSFLYFSAKLLGDASAIWKGRIIQRIYNRIIGRFMTRAFRRW